MNPSISLDTIVRRADGLVSCDLDGETALMSVANGKYYGLDPIGSRIWVLLEEARPVAAMCALLVAEYDVELHQCQSDVLGFLNDLAQDNLIEITNEATG
jgi:hypothetical protein